ncbi:hypothetical protein RYZ27_04115 [Hyphomonas sp. FCG-A18]|uniref:hypothetical protein n=1 Tax=Hyphomonas sp. FCG-A18 TaxID=3080019 RepID=UPI002B2EF9ED|nr:hypothetical protein RYZ27_04115 [Hyphomonas sp. FCG-A18]
MNALKVVRRRDKMSIRVATLLVGLSLIPFAHAEDVTAQQAIKELKDRGANIVDSVLIYGEPILSASIDGQGFRLILSQCSKPDYTCKVTIFSACQVGKPLSRDEMIRFANTQNAKPTSRGTAYVDRDGGIGDVICVRKRRDLHIEDKFDMADVFAWQLTLRDFNDAVEEAKRKRQVRDLLGIDSAPAPMSAESMRPQAPAE